MQTDTDITLSGTAASDSGPSSVVCAPVSAPGATPGIPSSDSEWLPIWRIARALDCSFRHARRELAGTPTELIRYQPQERGAPIKLYHISAHPALTKNESEPQSTAHSPRPAAASPDDLAIGQLRSEAIHLYIECRKRLPESEAAKEVCAAYLAHPKSRHIYIGERLAENNQRQRDVSVTLQGFSPGTLRSWHKRWQEGGLSALVPTRKGKAGRGCKDVPEAFLNLVQAWSVRARGDVRKGIAAALGEWPGDAPAVHYRTILRRLRDRDPEQFTDTLGKHGIATFRAKHSPDISRDYSAMGYNDEWQLDDVTQDFYGFDWSLQRMIRPYAYAIIRVATREWIAVVTTETPIVKDQVKALIGLALADPIGGIPKRIRFERGAVACDAALEALLISLGIEVLRTSMDCGTKHAGAFAEKGIGHPQGKGVIERAIRSLHNQPGLWDQCIQVGTMERTTAAQNVETIKAMILAKAKDGQIVQRLAPAQWQAAVAGAMTIYNDTPHSAMPEILDAKTSTPETLRYRHMSPNEYGAKIQCDIRVMAENLLPLFFARGTLVEVSKNGFTLNKFSYGRFDQDIQARVGTKVTAFQLPECPRVAYVAELGRCVDAWKMPKAGQEGDLIEIKRGIEQTKRNKYEQIMADVLAAGSQAVIDQTRLLANPLIVTPKKVETVSNPDLATAAQRQTTALTNFRDKQKARDARFKPDAPAIRLTPAPRRSLADREEELTAQLAALATAKKEDEAY